MKTLEELKAIREKMEGRIHMRSEDEKQIRVVVEWLPAESPAGQGRF